jgi:hypothetical protein
MDSMSQNILIPMFPLNLLPLPGELVPLHIFEPRYKQLLLDAENHDIAFGIFFSNEINEQKIGSLIKLESVIKRHPNGESDIVVKCTDLFTMDSLHDTFKNKLYPGGDVKLWNADISLIPEAGLYELFTQYLLHRNISHPFTAFDLYQIANELNLTLADRYRFVTCPHQHKEKFLMTQLNYQLHLLKQEEKSKDVFHLN